VISDLLPRPICDLFLHALYQLVVHAAAFFLCEFGGEGLGLRYIWRGRRGGNPLISVEGATFSQWRTIAQETFRISESTFTRGIKDLIAWGRVEKRRERYFVVGQS
jgi:hypothetical protein